MNHYTYKDYKLGGKVIFECVALDIEAADALFKASLGKDPIKLFNVAVSIEFNV